MKKVPAYGFLTVIDRQLVNILLNEDWFKVEQGMFCWLNRIFMPESIEHCEEQRLEWAGVEFCLRSRSAPAKELEWANMGLGFRGTTRRTSETQILKLEKRTGVSVNISASLWNMWTGHVSRVNYLQTSCYPMRIWSSVWTCEIFSVIMQYEGNMASWNEMSDWIPYHGKRLLRHMSLYWLHL